MSKYDQAWKIAEDNYSTWGQWVVECMNRKELFASFRNHLGEEYTLEEWVDIQSTIGSIYQEIESTAW